MYTYSCLLDGPFCIITYEEFHKKWHVKCSQKVELRLYGSKTSANNFSIMFGHWIHVSRITHIKKGQIKFFYALNLCFFEKNIFAHIWVGSSFNYFHVRRASLGEEHLPATRLHSLDYPLFPNLLKMRLPTHRLMFFDF